MSPPVRRPSAFGGAVALVTTGTVNGILSKLQFDTAVPDNGKLKLFHKPWFSTFVMFLSMGMLLPLAPIAQRMADRRQARRRAAADAAAADTATVPDDEAGQPLLERISASVAVASEEDGDAEAVKQQHPTWKRHLLLLIPTTFDLLATILQSAGLLTISASVFQMVRGSEVIFAALLSAVFLQRHLNGFHGSGICLVVAGITLVGLASVWGSSSDAAIDSSYAGSADSMWTSTASSSSSSSSSVAAGLSTEEMVRGMLLVIASEAIQAAQVCLEDWLMSTPSLAFSPLVVVGLEGLYGTILMGAVVLPLVAFLPGPEGVGLREDSLETFHMLARSPLLLSLVLMSIACMGIYNLAGMVVTSDLGATSRVVTETLRMALVWLANLAIFYFLGGESAPESRRHWGEPWTAYSWVQVVGFGVLVAGTLVYAWGDATQAQALRAKARWAQLRSSLRDLVDAARVAEPMRFARIVGPARIRIAALQMLFVHRMEAEVRRRHLAALGVGSRDGLEHMERPLHGRWNYLARNR